MTLLETRAFETIAIVDIVEHAGVSRASFYRHFGTKEALIDEIAVSEVEPLGQLVTRLLQPHSDRSACGRLVAHVRDRRQLLQVLLAGGAFGRIRYMLIAQVTRNFGETSLLDGEIPSTRLGITIRAGGALEILAWWLRAARPVGTDLIVECLDRLVARPAAGEEIRSEMLSTRAEASRRTA